MDNGGTPAAPPTQALSGAISGSPSDSGMPVLGVAASLAGRRWVWRLGEQQRALALAQQTGLPEIVARILAGRGVAAEDAASFLSPTLRAHLPDPAGFKDMEAGAERLAAAVISGEQIAVFGDYDVDGATSAALLARFFRSLGRKARIYVPDRRREGYGPNSQALEALRADGVSVVITVDCGITSFEPLARAAEMGLDVVVVDHHEAEPRLPVARAVINPNRLDESGACRQLAAVGVTFLLCVAVNRSLREAGWYSRGEVAEPDLRQWLDLVALGTVCDMVPLSGLNRAFVRQGLRILHRRGNRGLAALADVAGIDSRPGVYHLGFVLGPRVNAGGRVGQSDIGATLLATEDGEEAARLAAMLNTFNEERRAIERETLAAAMRRTEESFAAGGETPLVLLAEEGWHPGVIGLVANRLADAFQAPAVVIALEGEVGRGSARSVPGVDIGSAVIAARQAGLLVNGGGHVMAAGLTVERHQVPALRAFLAEHVGRQGGASAGPRRLSLDGVLAAGAATPELLESIEDIGPFGIGNAEPHFALCDLRLSYVDVVGEAHIRCSFSSADGRTLKGVAFRAVDTPLGEGLLKGKGRLFHVAGTLRLDTYRGRRAVEIHLDDAALAGSESGQ